MPGRAVGSSRGAGQPLDWPRFPARPLPRFPAAVAEGPAAARAGPGARCLGDASEPGRATVGDRRQGDGAHAMRPWHGHLAAGQRRPGPARAALGALARGAAPAGRQARLGATATAAPLAARRRPPAAHWLRAGADLRRDRRRPARPNRTGGRRSRPQARPGQLRAPLDPAGGSAAAAAGRARHLPAAGRRHPCPNTACAPADSASSRHPPTSPQRGSAGHQPTTSCSPATPTSTRHGLRSCWAARTRPWAASSRPSVCVKAANAHPTTPSRLGRA
jgi:hypothetical protein